MSLVVNHNLTAINASRNLGRHYGVLATSVRHLSSGLHIERASDDAAGLAIRELMRADIATLNQGVRNVNDAISMLQIHDGALQVIDEKLIRLRELAEQAATGTYFSDQRLMIDSEFQAMKSEITRIALATDFNGIKLLCNDTANKLFIGTGGGGGMPSTPPEIIGPGGGILNPDAITKDATITYGPGSQWSISSISGDTSFANWRVPILTPGGTFANVLEGLTITFEYNIPPINGYWTRPR